MLLKDYLKSEIMIPQVLHQLLPRKNIADIIDNSSLNEAVCLVAPYGCGKTLAVISWLRERNRSAAWLTLDETNNSAPMFFADLSASIMRLAGWQGDANDILSNPLYADEPMASIKEAISTAEKNGCDKILVIDNFQFISDSTLLRSIKKLIPVLLRISWRLFIISRAELPPVFNELILKRQICLITLQELNFNPEEIAEFFNINNCPVSQQEVLQISNETEGWPASLNIILTLSRGGSVNYGATARKYVMDFFETEVWEELDEDIRVFLLKTSILNKLTPASCNAVTEVGATLPILRYLFVNGLFISRLEKEDTYRYHRVFQDFLRYKLSSSDIDEREMYKKIAWWMFEKNEFEQAFHYFFKANDMYGLYRIFRVINPADIGIEKYFELTRDIISLNTENLQEYPLIAAKMALHNYCLGNITEMQRLYNIFLKCLEPGAVHLSPEEYAECMLEAGWLSYLNPDEPVLNNKKHKKWFSYIEHDPYLRSLHRSRAAVFRFPSVLRGVRDYCHVLETVNEFMRQNKDAVYSATENEVFIWRLYIVSAEYAYELEDFTLAENRIRELMTELEVQQFTDLYFICTVLLVKIVRAVHNKKEIGALMARLKSMILKNEQIFLLPTFHAFELRTRLLEGFTGQTEVFEAENKDYLEKPYFFLFYRHTTLVRALLSTGDYNEAILILGHLEYLCGQYKRVMDLIEVTILKSVAYYGLGHEDRACRYLTEALNQGREYGFIRIFSDDAKDLWPILNLVSMEINDDYIKKIIISCKKTLTRDGIKLYRKNQSKSGLTKAELKILKTLNAGMSYKEMALDNNIKVSTLKSHIQSIYAKLGVDNKTAAVIAAQKMGIID